MNWLRSIWNIYWNRLTWPLKIASAVIILIVFGGIFGSLKSCGKKKISIDQTAINKINSANRAERTAELQKQIEKNADVIATVDNRSTIAETNTVERNRAIDEKINAVDMKIQEARQNGRDVTGQELECILLAGENCS